MNKYEKALADLKAMVEVGGTLEEADEVVKVFEELVGKYNLMKLNNNLMLDKVSEMKAALKVERRVLGHEEDSDIRWEAEKC